MQLTNLLIIYVQLYLIIYVIISANRDYKKYNEYFSGSRKEYIAVASKKVGVLLNDKYNWRGEFGKSQFVFYMVCFTLTNSYQLGGKLLSEIAEILVFANIMFQKTRLQFKIYITVWWNDSDGVCRNLNEFTFVLQYFHKIKLF